MSFGFNRKFGWIGGGLSIRPPLFGLVQWLTGDDLYDKIGLVSAPTIDGTNITQTDVDMAYSTFWSADGSTLDLKDLASQTSHISGNGYVWINTIGGVVKDVLTFDHILSQIEYNKLLKFLSASENDYIRLEFDVDGSVIYNTEIWNDSYTWYSLLRWQEYTPLYTQPV